MYVQTSIQEDPFTQTISKPDLISYPPSINELNELFGIEKPNIAKLEDEIDISIAEL